MAEKIVKRKWPVVLLVILLLSLLFAQSSYAYYLFGKKLNYGVYNRAYYVGMSSPSYVNPTVAAVADWNWAVNPSDNGSGVDVLFWWTTNMSEASIRFWGENLPTQTWTGLTRFFSSNGNQISPSQYNWSYSSIIFNTDNAPAGQYNYMKAIAAHEMGHAFGLAHNSYDTGVIMYPYWNICTATSPTADDVSGVVGLYS